MNDLVSVILPVYNAEQYLEKCIQCVVNQTYKNLEIILVDDGSSDNCPKICDDWAQKDSRIRVLHKPNAGAGFARNTGIDNANGKFALFVDSDDYLEVNTIEKCLHRIHKHKADCALFSSCNVYPDGTVKKQKVMDTDSFFDEASLKNKLLPSLFTHTLGYGVSVWGKMFSLKIIKDNNIRFLSEREIYSEDALFVLEYFSKSTSAATLAENLYYYCENDTSLSRVYKEDRQEKNNTFLHTALRIAQKNNLPQTVSVHIKARYHGCFMVKLKQIISSDLPKKQKKALLKSEYKNKIFRSTLTTDVINVEKRSLKIFFTFVKLRLYFLSNLLLLYRVNK